MNKIQDFNTLKAEINRLYQENHGLKQISAQARKDIKNVGGSAHRILPFVQAQDIRLEYQNKLNQLLDLRELIKASKMEQEATNYFNRQFPGAEFKFEPKKNGSQSGCVLNVTTVSSTEKFFIKSHQYGAHANSSYSDSAKPVIVIEPFLYKFFEKLGIGPEAHFFYEVDSQVQNSSWVNFYIATRELKNFSTFGALDQLTSLDAFEGDNQIVGFHVLRVLETILLLTDLTRNPGNCGFVADDDGIDIRVVDFRIQAAILSRNQEALWRQYRNHLKAYSGIRASLCQQEDKVRARIARRMFEFLKEPVFSKLLEETQKEIEQIFSQAPFCNSELYQDQIELLEDYIRTVRGHYSALKTVVEEKAKQTPSPGL